MEMQEAIAYGKGREIGKAETLDEVLEIIDTAQTYKMFEGEEDTYLDKGVLREAVMELKGGAE